ncbi:MAG: tyrosine--tRNA ligase [Alphaproteobacteria bacterium]|nr:MAG: tyrosine--tRNA ligase [Alphaproteobacteria bacterium]
MTVYLKSEFLQTMQARGFIHQASHLEALDSKLCEGVQSAYIGFDATAQSLHVGNLINIMMLKWFQETGHKPITLMGGGTSKIGDPSFKDEQRNLLDDDTIEENMRHIRATCFDQFLNYGDGQTDAKMVNNNDWLSELSYLDFLRDYGRYFSVNRMIGFDSVKQRLDRESFLSLLEFNYMVMQGYDFVELHRREGTVLQMGGSDQWGNIINGVDLGHKSHRMQLFAMTTPLLTTPDGKKMGKTENGAVWLNADMLSPYDYYQFWRNVDDAQVREMLCKFTMMPMDDVDKLSALQGQEINEAKKILAFEATKLCHGEKSATASAETARQTFEQGQSAAGLPTIEVTQNPMGILDLLIAAKLVTSKGDARRLIAGGGARIDDVVVNDDKMMVDINDTMKLSAGKKKHILVNVI